MKMTRRILSWVLAIAMVVTCGITGLVLPASAEGDQPTVDSQTVNGSTPVIHDDLQDSEWKFSDGTSVALSNDPEDAANKALFLSGTDHRGGGKSVYSPVYEGDFSVGERYLLRFKVKHSGEGAVRVLVGWLNADDGGYNSNYSDIAATEVNAEWTWYQYPVTIVKEASSLQFVTYLEDSTKTDTASGVYIDEITLVPVTSDTNFVVDGDFEGNQTQLLLTYYNMGAEVVKEGDNNILHIPAGLNSLWFLMNGTAKDKVYEISFRYKGGKIAHWWSIDHSFPIEHVGSTAASDEWVTYKTYWRITSSTNGNYFMLRTDSGNGNAEIWMDDICIRELEVATSITLEDTTVRIGEAVEMAYTVEPEGAYAGALTWSSDSTAVTVSDGMVVGTPAADTDTGANVTVTRSTTDAGGKDISGKVEAITSTAAVTLSSEKYTGSIIPNGDFENYEAGDKAPFWNDKKTGTNAIVKEESNGNKYIEVPVGGSNVQSDKTIYLVEGKEYLFSFSVKKPADVNTYFFARFNASNSAPYTSYNVDDSGETNIAASTTDNVSSQYKAELYTTQWVTYSKKFTATATEAVYLSFSMYTGSTASGANIWVDNVEITETTVGETNLVKAGSFENNMYPHTLQQLYTNGAKVTVDPLDPENTVLMGETDNDTEYTEDLTAGHMIYLPVTTGKMYKISYRWLGTKATIATSSGDYLTVLETVGAPDSAVAGQWQQVDAYVSIVKKSTSYSAHLRLYEGSYIDDLQVYEVENAEAIEVVSGAYESETSVNALKTTPENAYPGVLTWTTSDKKIAHSNGAGRFVVGQGTVDSTSATITVTTTLETIAEADRTKTGTISISGYDNIMYMGNFDDPSIPYWGTTSWMSATGGVDDSKCLVVPAATTSLQVNYYTGRIFFKPNTTYKMFYKLKGSTDNVSLTFTNVSDDVDQTGAKAIATDADGWTTYSTTITTGDAPSVSLSSSGSLNHGWQLHIRKEKAEAAEDSSLVAYMDDIVIAEIGTVLVENNAAAKTLTVETATLAADDGLADVTGETVITVTAEAADGYVMNPGTLVYTDSTGVAKILNEELPEDTTFGGTTGTKFQFVMPADDVAIVSADFMSTNEATFAMDTIAASVHKNGDSYDGIRFLTRLNLADGFNANAEGAMTVTVGDETYKIVEIGSLLKRKDNETELTLANAGANIEMAGANRMWISRAYTEEKDVYTLVDYTESYIDFTVVMKTADATREYTSRGYMILENVENAEDTIEVYSETSFSDSINSAASRL